MNTISNLSASITSKNVVLKIIQGGKLVINADVNIDCKVEVEIGGLIQVQLGAKLILNGQIHPISYKILKIRVLLRGPIQLFPLFVLG